MTVSSVLVWQLVCDNTRCPHVSLVVSYKKKRCETSAGRQSAGRFRWLKSSVQLDGTVGGSLDIQFSPLARPQL